MTRVKAILSGPVLDVATTLAILVTCGTLVWSNRPHRPATAPVPHDPLDVTGAPSKGLSGAPLVMIEWSDFECPYCGKAARETLPFIDSTFIRSGRLRLVFRYHPLEEIHPHALLAAQAALCADRQHHFWEMHDSLFADQQHLDEASILRRAEQLALDVSAFRTCLAANSAATVRADGLQAEHLGLDTTPAFLIGRPTRDGRIKVESVISGAQPEAVFVAALTEESSTDHRRWFFVFGVLLAVAAGVAGGIRRARRRMQEQPVQEEVLDV